MPLAAHQITPSPCSADHAIRQSRKSSGVLDFSHLHGLIRRAGRLEKRIGDLQHCHASHQQERMNHRPAVLTAVSAIFLPLTLIAGIRGMNFKFMPELGHSLGYPFALGAMVAAGGG